MECIRIRIVALHRIIASHCRTADEPLVNWPNVCREPVRAVLWSRARASLLHVQSASELLTLDLLASNYLAPVSVDRGVFAGEQQQLLALALANNFEATGLGVKGVHCRCRCSS